MKKNKLFMLIGVPGSGKSTWINKGKFKEGYFGVGDTCIVSTDDIISARANIEGKTYDEMFKDNIKDAEKLMYKHVMWAVERGQNIVWDQTNLTKKSRAKKLIMIPDEYQKIAVFFETPNEEELAKRLKNRNGKTIPEHVMDAMIEMIEYPEMSEGFDRIEYIENLPDIPVLGGEWDYVLDAIDGPLKDE